VDQAAALNPAPARAAWRERLTGGRPGGPSPLRLLLFGVVALGSVYAGFVAPSVEQARWLVQHFGYFAMAGTFAWAVVAFGRLAPEAWRARPGLTRREAWVLGGLITALTLLAVLTAPYNYKVLYDEFVLQATAHNLHEIRQVGAMTRGYEVEGAFRGVSSYLDKRPIFFAFLVSLLHDVTGYREANAFALNTALLPVILGLLYLLARRLMAHGAACAAVVGFGAFSLLAYNATGAGMEMVNLAMLLLTILLGAFYLEAPDGRRLTALILGAVLLAQSRYESALYIAPTALVVLEGWRRRGGTLLPAAAILAPALLIPYALHNTYLSGSPQLWELRDGTESRFAAQFFTNNLVHAFRFFFDFSGTMTNSWWLGVAGLPALGWAAWRVLRAGRGWKAAPAAVVSLVVFGGAIAGGLSLLMFYYWGELDDPIVSRLSLPFCALLALSIAWLAEQLPAARRRLGIGVAIGGAALAYLTTGLHANATHWQLNLLMREIAWEGEVIAQLPPARRLIVTNKSALFWVTREISSVQIPRARWRAEQVKFHLDHHTFDEIIVGQGLRAVGPDGGFQVEPADRLPESYVLEPLCERRWGTRIARLSRVVEIRLARPVGRVEMGPLPP
jgi:hypothetical protein